MLLHSELIVHLRTAEVSDSPQRDGLGTERITTLVDGVFAIVLTLLILGVRAPAAASHAELLVRLRDLAPQMVSFLVSFLILGIFWFGHNMEMHWIVRSDRVHIGITLLFLLAVSFVPFSAALLGKNQQLPFASAVYAGNLCLAGVARLVHWSYATNGYRLTAPDIDPGMVHYVRRIFALVPILYIVAGASAWISPVVAIISFAVIPLLYVIPAHQTRYLTSLKRYPSN
jgi:uncharacterized membrane protein